MGGLPLSTLDTSERAGWSLLFLAVLGAGLSQWGQWSEWPAMAWLAPLVTLTGIGGLAATWAVRDRRVLERAALTSAFTTAGLGAGVDIAARHYYTTDSAAFTHLATSLLLRGVDPYRVRLRGVTHLLHPAANYWTYLVNGGHVIKVSYPAGALVLEAPLMKLGLTHLTTDWVDLLAWLVSAAILARVLPAGSRWLAGVLVLSGTFLGPFASGGTDALFVPFLMVALWGWDRAGERTARGWWIGPAALGVACSIKQSPWFFVPFLLVAVALEARGRGGSPARATLRYGAVVAGVFVLVDLPFMIWDFSAWLHGTLLPLTSPLVPDGQGLISLALHGVTGGAQIHLLWYAAALVSLALVVALALHYPRLKVAWPFLVPLCLFLPGRSLSNSLVDFAPAALVAALSVAPAPAGARLALSRRRVARALWIAPGALAGVAVVAGLSSAPLTIQVLGTRPLDQHQAIRSVTVSVLNRSSATLTPHFSVAIGGGHPTAFWAVVAPPGAWPLRPESRTTLILRPTSWFWAPPEGGYLVVTAVTAHPAAISTSGPRRWVYRLPAG